MLETHPSTWNCPFSFTILNNSSAVLVLFPVKRKCSSGTGLLVVLITWRGFFFVRLQKTKQDTILQGQLSIATLCSGLEQYLPNPVCKLHCIGHCCWQHNNAHVVRQHYQSLFPHNATLYKRKDQGNNKVSTKPVVPRQDTGGNKAGNA